MCSPKTILRIILKSSIFYLFLFLSCQAQATLMNIVVEGGQLSGLPIAIIPFAVEPGEKDRIKEITDVISSDLQSSGQFKPLSLSDVKEFPSQQTEVNTSYWKAQGIEDLVIGTVQKNGSNYTVHFTLLDMVKKTSDAQAQVLLDMQFSNIAANKLRALAHHI